MSESGEAAWVNPGSTAVRREYARWQEQVCEREKALLSRYRVDSVSIATNEDYVKGLMGLFSRR